MSRTIATTNLVPILTVVMAFCHYSGAENYRSARLGRPYLPARDGVVAPGEAATVLLASADEAGGAVGGGQSGYRRRAKRHDVTVLLPFT